MNTEFFRNITEEELAKCGALLRRGEIVAFPTETVYGLGADALNDTAVAKIFAAKNRPADNPLIAHVSDADMVPLAARMVTPLAQKLFDAFWPGPLTVILPKAPALSAKVTAGGDTVAVRCPDHPIARALIKSAGVPIVAPSANLSGKPSPTDFETTAEDLSGKVAAIIDGGACSVGVESTVVLPTGENSLRILRPGAVTPEMLRALGLEVEIDPNVLAPLDHSRPVLSPGMKHRHYAPKAPLTIVTGAQENVLAFLRQKQTEGAGILCFEGELEGEYVRTYGAPEDDLAQSRQLFAALRQFDKLPVREIFARKPTDKGMGLAVYNRLLRAAEFTVLEVEK
ncbi:MAG: threonylcarbamoyl-AMP synthase [Clostridia bacterium]|nr:threonylcarbamoyl-AMP synthase [Clostridia bacterium]